MVGVAMTDGPSVLLLCWGDVLGWGHLLQQI